jgi:energy-coupling factor transport system ATP-binding protein
VALIADNLSFSYNPAISRRDATRTKKSMRSEDTAQRLLALDGFSASFAPGEIAAIMGPNGCGKTTLAKLIVGMLKPLHGAVTLDGENLRGRTLTEIGRRIGFVSRQPERQLFCTSVREEVAFGLKCAGVPQAETEERTAELLDYFGLSEYEQAFPLGLSAGEKQRLLTAAVIATRPSYLILDEPTSALDRGRRRDLGILLRRLAKDEQTGVILICHDERFVAEYADRIIMMEEGRNA